MDMKVKQEESANGKYRITISYDECAESPCTNWDMGACFLFEFGDSSTLHDKCHWREIYNPKWDDNRHSLEDAIMVLVGKHVDNKYIIKALKEGTEHYMLRYDRAERKWELLYKGGYYGHTDWEHDYYIDGTIAEITEDAIYFLDKFEKDELVGLLQDHGTDIVAKEFSLRGCCKGDYVEGVAFCTKEWYAKYDNTDTTDWEKKAIEIIDAELDSVNRWMWGDVYGFVLEERKDFTKTYADGTTEEDFEWEEIDSCWGFFCDPDEIIDEYLPKEEELGKVG